MIFNNLITAYTQIENMIASGDPAINEKLSNLAHYIHENGQAIQDDLLKHEDHIFLLRKIGQIANEDIHNSCELLELKVLLKGDDPKNLAEWIIKNKDETFSGNAQDLFFDLSKARERLKRANLLVPEVGYAISELIISSFGLTGVKNPEIAKTAILSAFKQNSLEGIAHWINTKVISLHSDRLSSLKRDTLEALAHWINAEKVPLLSASISENEAKAIAPYLHYVDYRGLFTWEIPEKFVSSCKNAYELHLHDIRITELKELPPQLQVLTCFGCKKITAIDLSNCPLLQKLDCHKCGSLTAIDLSHSPQLLKLYCGECPISTLDLSHNPLLEAVFCRQCPNITTLDLSHNPNLWEIYCPECPIENLDLSHNPQLQYVDCSSCPLSTLDFSNNLQLQRVNCNQCQRLTSLGAALPNTLEALFCEECPNLSQLPQLPHTATVHSGNSRCGALNSFKVYPADLEKKPKQVLLDLGKILLQNKPFPNIVYMDPRTDLPTAGLDAGGLRRQLVSTLCENLFKKDSGFPFLEEAGYQTPTLSEDENPDALRTFARLLGLAATSSLLTGTNLDPSFFQSLFTLTDQELDQPLSEDLKKKLYMARQGLSLESFTKEDEKGMAEESGILRATAIAAKELKTTLGKGFRKQNIKEFIVNVQGIPITKEKLKANIHCNNRNYKLWIDKFIDKLPLTVGKQTYELKHLLMLFTGYYSLGGGPITIEVFPERKYLDSATVIHTCYQSMELPGDLNETLLHKELTDQLALLKTFNAV
jgi:hypothetical protein